MRASLLCFFLFIETMASAQTWQAMGPDDFITPTAGIAGVNLVYTPYLFAGTKNQYFIYKDVANGNGLTVKQFINGSWTTLGTAGFTPLSNSFTLTEANGLPYLFYAYNSNNLVTMQKFTNGVWSYVSGLPSNCGYGQLNSITDFSNKPVLTYADYYSCYVYTYFKARRFDTSATSSLLLNTSSPVKPSGARLKLDKYGSIWANLITSDDELPTIAHLVGANWTYEYHS